VSYLLDTNVAWRRFDKTDPNYHKIKSTIDGLVADGEEIFVTAQNLIEFVPSLLAH
jgi:predicted nucleic-acid-binding protein